MLYSITLSLNYIVLSYYQHFGFTLAFQPLTTYLNITLIGMQYLYNGAPKCQHEGAARVLTFQPRGAIFKCCTNNHTSSVLLYDKLLKIQN